MERENLLNYYKYQPSKSCYLDGRYFNIVLRHHSGLIEQPLYIHIDENGVYTQMINTLYSKNDIGLLRVVITSKDIRHSMLVVFDHDQKQAWIYDPNNNGSKIHRFIVKHIMDYLANYLDYEYFDVEQPLPPKDNLKQCTKSGVCNALVLLQAYTLINGKEFGANDIKNVRRFMTAVETTYELPPGQPDIEMDSDQLLPTLLGAGIGAGVGYAVAGPVGAIGFGTLGGIAGYGLSGGFNQ